MNVHVDSDDRGHAEQIDHHLCNDCSETFKSRFGLKLHCKSIHDNDKQVKSLPHFVETNIIHSAIITL